MTSLAFPKNPNDASNTIVPGNTAFLGRSPTLFVPHRFVREFPQRGMPRPREPVISDELAGMHRSNRAVAAPKIIGRAILVASPTDALRVQRIE
jgi:hypothetical protein